MVTAVEAAPTISAAAEATRQRCAAALLVGSGESQIRRPRAPTGKALEIALYTKAKARVELARPQIEISDGSAAV